MARLPRLIFPMQAHHVLLTGNNGGDLFTDRADFERMFNFIYEQSVREDVLVHAYLLLQSQVHLILTPKSQDSLSKMMQGLGRSYVRYFNNRYDRSGTLWGGRYKSSAIQSGDWLKKCLIYLDCLPMRVLAQNLLRRRGEADKSQLLIQSPGHYEWSSYLHYTGRRHDVFITAHADVWSLGNTPFAREAQYEQLVQKGLTTADSQQIEQAIKGGWILGDDTFIEHLQTQAHRRVAKAKPGRPAKALPAPTSGTHFR